MESFGLTSADIELEQRDKIFITNDYSNTGAGKEG